MSARINIDNSANDIARRLLAEMKAQRIVRVDIEIMRSFIAGWIAGKELALSTYDVEVLETLALRKFVERCA